MTAQTRTVNKGKFESGDKPTGSDYSDLIDSYLSLQDSSEQTVTSKLTISGGIATTTVSAATVYADTFIASAATLTNIVMVQHVSASSARINRLGIGTAAPTADGIHLVATEGNLKLDIATTAIASGGTGGAVPASAQAFAIVQINGVSYRIPLFNVK